MVETSDSHRQSPNFTCHPRLSRKHFMMTSLPFLFPSLLSPPLHLPRLGCPWISKHINILIIPCFSYNFLLLIISYLPRGILIVNFMTHLTWKTLLLRLHPGQIQPPPQWSHISLFGTLHATRVSSTTRL